MLVDEPLLGTPEAYRFPHIVREIGEQHVHLSSLWRTERISQGVYIHAWPPFSGFLDTYDHDPPMVVQEDDGYRYRVFPYGVCDHPDEVLEYYREVLDHPERQFLVLFDPVYKEADPPRERGGFRYHKHGAYVGKRENLPEYLADDKDVTMVYVFKILEKIL